MSLYRTMSYIIGNAINLLRNLIQHYRPKHIEIRHHFIHDYVQKGVSVIKKRALETQRMIAYRHICFKQIERHHIKSLSPITLSNIPFDNFRANITHFLDDTGWTPYVTKKNEHFRALYAIFW
ncbi:hypothetical protein CR513_25451, partial [Mucuna pruriens]